MTRTMKVLSTLVFGGMLFVGVGCEDTVCKEALAKSTVTGAESAKLVASQAVEIASLKGKLTSVEQALAAAKKEVEEAKAAKPVEPAPAEKEVKGKKK